MGQTKLDATLNAGPPNGGDTVFPGSVQSTPINLTPSPKTWTTASGILSRAVSVASPSWVELGEVGSGKTVAEANFIYIRTNANINVRTTQAQSGGDVVCEHKVYGLFIWEVPDSEPVTKIELQGSATIELFVQGK